MWASGKHRRSRGDGLWVGTLLLSLVVAEVAWLWFWVIIWQSLFQ